MSGIYIHIYLGKWERKFFSPIAIYYSERLLLLPSTLCHHYYAVLFLILPVPTRVFFAVVCGDLTFFLCFRFVSVNRIVCVSTTLSCTVPHATRLSLPVFPLRSIERFLFFFSLFLRLYRGSSQFCWFRNWVLPSLHTHPCASVSLALFST